jgi:2-keto-4-pentenoate hydratase/2-oxohepta-3-ene-1,7-dioic acid hydratase in catechol pathway
VKRGTGQIARPGKIVCVGRNYAAHAAELGNVVPERPLIFFKPPSAVIASGEAIRIPRESAQVEHEGEIGLVVGHRARRIAERDALSVIAGVTCVNDVTARDLQKTDGQWARAKGFDTFCPVGPRVVALSDLPALETLEVRCRVNGSERQHGAARHMAFGFAYLVAYISNVMTLEPGDLIATGTPDGVGPLRPGDLVEVEIPGVGVLANPVDAE